MTSIEWPFATLNFDQLIKNLEKTTENTLLTTETWLNTSKSNPFEAKEQFVYHASYGKGKGSCIISPEKKSINLTVATEKFQIVSLPVMGLQLTVVYLKNDAHLPDVVKAMEQILDLQIAQVILLLLIFTLEQIDNDNLFSTGYTWRC